ncbi:MAG: PAS domain S-box protein [Chloroflexi bacterium]|nr:PAS domain S-box protein [Chloroflexota bacterium]
MKPWSTWKLTEPAFGAVPIRPYPLNALMRWSLLAVFAVYIAAGQTRDPAAAAWIALGGMAVVMAFEDSLFLRARRDDARLFRAWSVILVIDIGVLTAAASFDHNEFSPIPTLAVATVFTAGAMFRGRYTIALTALAAAMAVTSHVTLDVAEGHFTFWAQGFSAVVILAAGMFATLRGQTEEGLRRKLTGAQEREREQTDALRSALEAARLSQSRFDALSKHAPAIIALYDRNRIPVFASRYLETAFGLRQDEIGDLTIWATRLANDDRTPMRDTVAAAIEGRVSDLEFTLLDHRGEPRRMVGVFFPTEGGAGAIMRDVTSERELAAQVMRAQQMETVGTLAGGIAHDFNNLLTAIIGNIYLAGLGLPPDSPALPLLQDATTAGQRGADLVRRLLEYSRPAIPEREPLSVARLVDETAQLARHGLMPQIELMVVPPDPSATVEGSFSALQQVLLNLLVNARDAMPGNGRITVTSGSVTIDPAYCLAHAEARPGRYHVIRVVDTGTGIPPEALSRIFDPFFTTKEVGKGTGLGLSTALSVLRAHGGWMDVETRQGRGSTFRMLLPAVEPAPCPG